MKYLLILFFTFSLNSLSAQFTQTGAALPGNGPNDNFGFSIAMDTSGKIIAVGAPLFDSDFGQVRVYQQIAGTWTQIGQDLDGTNIGEQFGFSVGLSANGKRLALGGIGGTQTQGGHVRVYDFVGGQWIQAGSTLLGEAAGDQFGYSLALNAAGDRLVAGAINHNGDAGQVRVFAWNNQTWTQLGTEIEGQNPADDFGVSVSMSATGNIMAAGAHTNDAAASDAGQVRIYQWQNNAWMQLGNAIEGQNANEFLGLSVSLRADGQMLATGASGHNHGAGIGSVRVYQLDNDTWTQVGSDIRSNSNSEAFGQVVRLSGNGQVLAVGTPSNDDHATSSGKVNLYRLDNGQWSELPDPIRGTAQFDNLGKSLALNQPGNRVAVGANLAGGTAGYAVVYQDSLMPVGLVDAWSKALRYHLQVSPRQVAIEFEQPQNQGTMRLLALDGKEVLSQTFTQTRRLAFSHQLVPGVYLLVMQTRLGWSLKKLWIR